MLAPDSSSTLTSLKGASTEPGEPVVTADPVYRSVWYSWTPASTGTAVLLTAAPETEVPVVIEVFRGGSLASLSAAGMALDDSCALYPAAAVYPVGRCLTLARAVAGVEHVIRLRTIESLA